MLDLLDGVTMGEGRYVWRWRPGEDGAFRVNSCYRLLEGLWLVDGDLTSDKEVVF